MEAGNPLLIPISNTDTNGILVRTERISGSDSGSIGDANQLNVVRVKKDPTDKPMVLNHDWEFGMYPVGNKNKTAETEAL